MVSGLTFHLRPLFARIGQALGRLFLGRAASPAEPTPHQAASTAPGRPLATRVFAALHSRGAGDRPEGLHAAAARSRRLRPRQALNLLLAGAQLAAIGVAAVRGFGAEREVTEPPVVPALYTFSIWFVIYAGSLIYAAYQARPAQQADPLLRRVGGWTAAAFLFTTLWALAQTLGWAWATVACMFGMLSALLGAFVGYARAPLSRAQDWLVAAPLSIFLGYVTVASIANPASVLYQSGVQSLLGLGPTPWAVLMLAVGVFCAAALTRWSRGNVPYALAVIWALVGVTVQNVAVQPNSAVAWTAALGAAALGGVLVWARRGAARAATPAAAAGQ